MERGMITALKVVKDIADWRQQSCYLAFSIDSPAPYHTELKRVLLASLKDFSLVTTDLS